MKTERSVTPRTTMEFVLLGALAGLLLPLAGVLSERMLQDLGYVFGVYYWHLLVAPALSGAAGYAFAQATNKAREADRARQSHFAEANAVFDGLGTGVFKTAPEGRIIFANRGLSDLLGYGSPAELTSGPVQRLYADPEDRRTFLEELGKTGSVYGWPVTCVKRGGEPFPATITAHLQAGQILGVVSRAGEAGDEYFIDVCSSCDKARAASGEWQKLSEYVIQNMEDFRHPGGELLFSHGICPACAEALYGDLLKG